MAIYPENIGEPEGLLKQMRETPSLLPNKSIYQAAEQDPEHFDDHMHTYARQLGVSKIRLLVLTYDFGPLERAIKRCTLLPVVAEHYIREFPKILRMHDELFGHVNKDQ